MEITKENLRPFIIQHLKETNPCGIQSVDMETSFKNDLGMDSLDMVSLIMDIENIKELEVDRISNADSEVLVNCETVDEFIIKLEAILSKS